MKLDPRKLSDIKLGMIVEIEDSRTQKLVEGKIIFIVSQSDHPEGIFVKIDNKDKGHIKKIIKTTIESQPENQTNEIELLSESFNLEYKESFKYHGPDESKKWIPGFTVFKAISGLANAEGGKLVIGVKDEKNKPLKIAGLKDDFEFIGKIKVKNYFPYSGDRDGMELRLISEFEHYFPGQELVKNLVKVSFIGKKTEEMICVIDIERSTEAVVMYDRYAPEQKRGPTFFVRVNNQTIPYKPEIFCRYWAKHLLGMLGQDKIFLS